MKTLYLFLITFLLLISTAKGQITDQKTSAKLKELQLSKIDTIITYYPYCLGSIVAIEDTTKCYSYTTKYLLWAHKGVNYIQRFDDCYNYEPIANVSGDFFRLIKLHLAKLKSEKIKVIVFRKKVDGKWMTLNTYRDHSCHDDFDFIIRSNKFSKYIDEYFLDTQYVDDFDNSKIKHPNLNYHYNQHTYLKKLKDLVEKEIARLQFTKLN